MNQALTDLMMEKLIRLGNSGLVLLVIIIFILMKILFLLGTMGAEPQPGKVDLKKGNLYSLEADKKLKRHVSNIHISNGLAWNSDMKKFFYIDSGDKRIDQFDYDVKTGTICKCLLYCFIVTDKVTLSRFS